MKTFKARFESNFRTQIMGSDTLQRELQRFTDNKKIVADKIFTVDGDECMGFYKPMQFFKDILEDVEIHELEKNTLIPSKIVSITFSLGLASNNRLFVFVNNDVLEGENIFIETKVVE